VGDAEEWSRRARNEDTDLVDGIISWVEGTEFSEWGIGERKEESWSHTLIYGVFSDVYEKKGNHAIDVVRL
jgi:hypothetical protein